MKNQYSFRSVLLLACLAVSSALTSCDDIKNAVKITFGYDATDVDFTIQPTTQTTFSSVATKTSTLQAELDKNKAAVEKVTLKSIKFDLQPGSGTSNLGLISGGTASISANGQTAKLGEFQNAASNTQSITVPVQNADDLKQYLQASQFTIQLQGTTRAAIPQAMNVKATISFDVTGKAK